MKIKNLIQAACVHAAKTLLERLDKSGDTPDLPPGSAYDVSGMSLTITFGAGTVVVKAEGKDGDGVRPTMATTNLNGWAVLTVLFDLLMKFKQHNISQNTLISAVEDAITRVGGTTQAALFAIDPGMEEKTNFWKRRIGPMLPKREETTRRYVKAESEPVLNILQGIQRKAA